VKPPLKKILGMNQSFFFLLLGAAVFSFGAERWPWKSKMGLYLSMVGFGCWFIWTFFIIPFRAGLKANTSDLGES
jgi:hypothetical protein